MKKFLPIVLAIVVFGVALALNQPEPQVTVVVAAADLPEGKVLSEADLAVKEMPKSLAPEGAVSDMQSLVGSACGWRAALAIRSCPREPGWGGAGTPAGRNGRWRFR